MLLNITKTNEDKHKNVQQIAIQKFPILNDYKYNPANKVKAGQTIRYVDLQYNKLSTPMIVIEIIHNKSLMIPDKTVKSIVLFNTTHKTYIKLNPLKFYIFVSYGIKRSNDL